MKKENFEKEIFSNEWSINRCFHYKLKVISDETFKILKNNDYIVETNRSWFNQSNKNDYGLYKILIFKKYILVYSELEDIETIAFYAPIDSIKHLECKKSNFYIFEVDKLYTTYEYSKKYARQWDNFEKGVRKKIRKKLNQTN